MGSGKRIIRLKRYHQIIKVLLTHGLGYLVKRMGWEKLTPAVQRAELYSCIYEPDYQKAVRWREALTELGPTFVKLGQILSTRPDLLPPAYIKELEKLQDKVTPMTEEQVIKQITAAIGDPDIIFAQFDRQPLASASIGQVHRAKLNTGEQVIIKVQRPDLEETVKKDLEIMRGLARLSERRSAEAKRIGLVALIDDYARMLLRELDYEREARNTERIYYSFKDDPRVVIPRVYREYSTRVVLTEEYIEGVKLTDIKEINARGWDRSKLSRLGTEAFLSQVILHGFFQADPHPGNILIIDEEHIAFIDFGQMGTITETRLVYLGELLLGISNGETDRVIATMRDMDIIDRDIKNEEIEEDFVDLIEHISSTSIGKIDMNRLRVELMDIAYRHQLKIPSYLTALMKALITVEGVGKKLDPTFDFMEIARPLADKVYKERLKPNNVTKYIRRRYYQDIKPFKDFPADFHQLVRNYRDGKVNLHISFSRPAERKMEQLVSRLGVSLVIAAALISSALVIRSADNSANYVNLIGVGGFVVAVCGLTVFLLRSLRS